MKILVAQLNPTVGDLAGNVDQIIESIYHAKEKKADIVVFGELMLCGYPPEDLIFHRSFIDSMELYLERIISESLGHYCGARFSSPQSRKGREASFQ